jgi:hypothetical protein
MPVNCEYDPTFPRGLALDLCAIDSISGTFTSSDGGALPPSPRLWLLGGNGVITICHFVNKRHNGEAVDHAAFGLVPNDAPGAASVNKYSFITPPVSALVPNDVSPQPPAQSPSTPAPVLAPAAPKMQTATSATSATSTAFGAVPKIPGVPAFSKSASVSTGSVSSADLSGASFSFGKSSTASFSFAGPPKTTFVLGGGGSVAKSSVVDATSTAAFQLTKTVTAAPMITTSAAATVPPTKSTFSMAAFSLAAPAKSTAAFLAQPPTLPASTSNSAPLTTLAPLPTKASSSTVSATPVTPLPSSSSSGSTVSMPSKPEPQDAGNPLAVMQAGFDACDATAIADLQQQLADADTKFTRHFTALSGYRLPSSGLDDDSGVAHVARSEISDLVASLWAKTDALDDSKTALSSAVLRGTGLAHDARSRCDLLLDPEYETFYFTV